MAEKTRVIIPVSEFRLTARETDRVLIDCPSYSCGRKYNGKEGVITRFQDEDWILVRLDGGVDQYRFRPDELKVL